MNIYILIFFIINGSIMIFFLITALAMRLHYLKLKRAKQKNSKWFQDFVRFQIFYRRIMITVITTWIGSLFNFWLLWMGGIENL